MQRENLADNDGHNNSRLFDVLPIFLFTASRTKRNYL